MNKRVAIYGGSFNPPGKHHARIVKVLAKIFDSVIVIPCGNRSDKDSVNMIDPEHRKEMIRIVFEGVPKVKIDYYDLDNNDYTPTYFLQQRYEELYPDAEIRHIVGSDLIRGGHKGDSEIQRVWAFGKIIWQSLNWVVIYRPGYEIVKDDLPPSSMLVAIPNIFGSSTIIRERLATDKGIDALVIPEVERYIKEYNLYKGR